MAQQTRKENPPRGRDEDIPGVVFDIKRYAIHDGPGIRTTIFFKGCPLRCWWCHNPEGLRPDIENLEAESKDSSRKPVRVVGERRTVGSIMNDIARDVLFYDESGGGVTFSGGEPLMQPEFLRALLVRCRREGIHRALDTCGYASRDVLLSIVELVDLFLYDVKFMDSGLHKKYTGRDNRLILSNLKIIDRLGKRTIIRFPLIPGITDTRENVTRMAEFLSSLKNIRDIDLLPYHHLAAGKYRRLHIPNRMDSLPEPDPGRQMLEEITRIFEARGYRVNRGGNHE